MPRQRKASVPGSNRPAGSGLQVHMSEPEVSLQARAGTLSPAGFGSWTVLRRRLAIMGNEWLTSRAERTERKQQREAAPDPEAQAKRAAAREAKVASGLDELELWMRDLVRMGIASLPGKEYGFWV